MRDSKIAQNRKQMFGNKIRVIQGVRACASLCQVGASWPQADAIYLNEMFD